MSKRFRGLPGSGRQAGASLMAHAQQSIADDIMRNREDAAKVALKILFAVLHQQHGFGLNRLTRIGDEFNRQLEEFYSDRDVQEDILTRYLARIGFLLIDNDIHVTKNPDGSPVPGADVINDVINKASADKRKSFRSQIIDRGGVIWSVNR